MNDAHLKRVWFNEHAAGQLFSITLESTYPEPDFMQLHASGLKFPEEPDEDNPLRHTLNIGLFTPDDLVELYIELGEFLNREELI